MGPNCLRDLVVAPEKALAEIDDPHDWRALVKFLAPSLCRERPILLGSVLLARAMREGNNEPAVSQAVFVELMRVCDLVVAPRIAV